MLYSYTLILNYKNLLLSFKYFFPYNIFLILQYSLSDCVIYNNLKCCF